MSEIVKVQRPITPRGAPALVYAEGRKMMRTMALPPAALKQMPDDLKAFFEAEWTGSGWTIGKRVAPRDW